MDNLQHIEENGISTSPNPHIPKSPNLYLPYLMTVEKVTQEAPGVKTFRLKFQDEEAAEQFSFRAGQFGEYSAFGDGESTFCIASSPTRKGYIECTFREAGKVTSSLARLEEGDTMGFRGPFGNTFPIDQWKGKNLLFIAGGIALPPMGVKAHRTIRRLNGDDERVGIAACKSRCQRLIFVSFGSFYGHTLPFAGEVVCSHVCFALKATAKVRV